MNRGKSRSSATHRASSGYPTIPAPIPLNTGPATFHNVPTHSTPYSPPASSGPGMYYNPDNFMQPSNEKANYPQYNIAYDNHPQTQSWSIDFNASSAPPNYQTSGIYHQVHPIPFPSQTNPYQPTGTVPLPVHDHQVGPPPMFPHNVGSPVAQGKERYTAMDIEEKPGDGETSPPDSPSSTPDNNFADSAPSQSASDNKRPRDKHRKEIENRAAEKRKTAVKKLQRVLSIRTQGLPENGLANQLHMAADQLDEDGRTINQLKHDKSALKKKCDELQKSVANLEAENASLKGEVQALKRSA